MAASVCIHEDVLTNFLEMRGKKYHQYSFYRLDKDATCNSIVFDRCVEGDRDTDRKMFQTFVDDLPLDECRYVIYDFKYTTKEEGKCNKLAFILW